MKHQERKKLIDALGDREYRHHYADSIADSLIAAQIKANREARDWTQADLGTETGMKQSRISEIEDVNYGSWTINTLRRLARAFDLALIVRFVSFSKLVDEHIAGFNKRSLVQREFIRDTGLLPRDPEPEETSVWSVIRSIRTPPTEGARVESGMEISPAMSITSWDGGSINSTTGGYLQ
jgi:transcriptional regulator with XRE-family HTH domain